MKGEYFPDGSFGRGLVPCSVPTHKSMEADLAALRAQNAKLREALFSIEQSAHPDAKIPRTEYEWAMSLVSIARAALSEAS